MFRWDLRFPVWIIGWVRVLVLDHFFISSRSVVSVVIEVRCIMSIQVPGMVADNVWFNSRVSLTWEQSLFLSDGSAKFLNLALEAVLGQAVRSHLVSARVLSLVVPVLLMRLIVLIVVPGMVSLVVGLDVRMGFSWPSVSPLSQAIWGHLIS